MKRERGLLEQGDAGSWDLPGQSLLGGDHASDTAGHWDTKHCDYTVKERPRHTTLRSVTSTARWVLSSCCCCTSLWVTLVLLCDLGLSFTCLLQPMSLLRRKWAVLGHAALTPPRWASSVFCLLLLHQGCLATHLCSTLPVGLSLLALQISFLFQCFLLLQCSVLKTCAPAYTLSPGARFPPFCS